MDASIFVSCYYNEKTISKTLDSILSQKTDYTYEIIITDDLSQDNSAAVIKSYQEKFPNIIRAFINNVNIGLMRNFERFILEAKGEIALFCEADDYWINDNKLHQQVSFLRENKDYTAYFGVTDLLNYSTNQLYKNYFNKNAPLGNNSLKHNLKNIISARHTSSMAMQMSTLKLFNQLTSHKYYKTPWWDQPLFLFCSMEGKVYYSDETFSVYTRSKGTFTANVYKEKTTFKTFNQGLYNIPLWLVNKFPKYAKFKNDILKLYAFSTFHLALFSENQKNLKRGETLLNKYFDKDLVENFIIESFMEHGFASNDKFLFNKGVALKRKLNQDFSALEKIRIIAMKSNLLHKIYDFMAAKLVDNSLLNKLLKG